jgi:hypothetical protein
MRSLWLLLVVGCGTEGSGGAVIEVTARGAQLVVVQDGDEPFRPLALDENDTGTFQVTSGYWGVGMLCVRPFGSSMTSSFRTSQFVFDTEARPVFLPCSFADQVNARISGTTAPDAQVWAVQSVESADETGAYAHTVQMGEPVDIVAFVGGETPRMFVARDVPTTADLTLDLPVLEQGAELVEVIPVVSNANLEDVTFNSDLTTPSTYAFFESRKSSIHIPPLTALGPNDRPAVWADANGCSQQKPAAESISLRIPSPLTTSISEGASKIATWTADPAVAWGETSLFLSTEPSPDLEPADRYRMTLFATVSWHAARGSSPALAIPDVALEIAGWTDDLGSFRAGQAIRATAGISVGERDADFISCANTSTLTW